MLDFCFLQLQHTKGRAMIHAAMGFSLVWLDVHFFLGSFLSLVLIAHNFFVFDVFFCICSSYNKDLFGSQIEHAFDGAKRDQNEGELENRPEGQSYYFAVDKLATMLLWPNWDQGFFLVQFVSLGIYS